MRYHGCFINIVRYSQSFVIKYRLLLSQTWMLCSWLTKISSLFSIFFEQLPFICFITLPIVDLTFDFSHLRRISCEEMSTDQIGVKRAWFYKCERLPATYQPHVTAERVDLGFLRVRWTTTFNNNPNVNCSVKTHEIILILNYFWSR